MTRLKLPQVTLCAASSVNVEATVLALEASLTNIEFGACLLFTDQPARPRNQAIRVVPITRLASASAYSHFMLTQLAAHIETSHCLVVQWDGHVLDAGRWDSAFLDYDYIGARWPQFSDGHDVGNGGFSLRSRRLLQSCTEFEPGTAHPEDVAIGRTHREWLEAQGMRFAPSTLADRFSAERVGDPCASFGFHGIWHMPRVLGVDRFWAIYRRLDDRSTMRHDTGALLKQVAQGRGGLGRMVKLVADRMREATKRRDVSF